MSDTTGTIKRLAAEAGSPAGRELTASAFSRLLLTGTVCAMALAVLVICLVFAGTFEPNAVLRSYPFHFKVSTMALLAIGAFVTLRHQGIPGSNRWVTTAIVPGILVLFLLALFDRSGFPVLGRDALSVPICYFAILGASLPAFVLLLGVMRRGVVTQPAAAGAAAGLLAGALGAMAYAIACKNNGALFVFIWYGLAIGSVTAAGAAAGQRWLRW